MDAALASYLGYRVPVSPNAITAERALRAYALASRWNTMFYDGTANGPDFATHFQNASNGSANVHANPESRRVLRNRVRFELGNNSYMRGVIDTHTLGIVGRCPLLRILHEEAGVTRKQAEELEKFIRRWQRRVRFGSKIRRLYSAKISDGEGLAVIASNPRIRMRFPVALDLKLLECDQLMADPTKPMAIREEEEVDGVLLDSFGNPEFYRILKHHPAGTGLRGITATDFLEVPEEYVLHYFREFRAGQRRGIPELTPALLPAAAIRRYTMATVKAAELAASISFLIETDSADNEADATPPYEYIEAQHNMGMTLPEGWKGKQLKAEQPVAEYPEFKRELIGEQGRCLGQSTNAATGDSSDASFSSARLDDLNTGVVIQVERYDLEDFVLNKVMWHFGMEAVMAESSLSVMTRRAIDRWVFNEGEFLPSEWRYDAKGYSDPETESKANDTDLRNGSRSLSDVLMKRDGTTLEDHLAKLKRERDLAESMGVSLGYLVMDPGATAPGADPAGSKISSEEDDDEEDDDEEETASQRRRRQRRTVGSEDN